MYTSGESIPQNSSPVWHPYTQMKTALAPMEISRGEGAWLYRTDGSRILDLISSWWVNLHGHAHPHIVSRIATQAAQLEQVIFAGFTHQPAIQLATTLCQILPGNPDKIFYSDNGSTSIEVGLKMAFQYWDNLNSPRHKILAFRNSYHGDTFGAMSVSARSVFTRPFIQQLFEVEFLPDPLPENIPQCLDIIRTCAEANNTAAFIYEPLVLGSAGMIMYESEILNQLLTACKETGILLIADEVMTGFGRTGTMFASEQCIVKPDIICLSKGLTGGFLPMGVTSASAEIYAAFHQNDRMKTFFHGHSYTANPLACTAALASLELFETESTLEKIKNIEDLHHAVIQNFQAHPMVTHARVKGVILALTLKDGNSGPEYLSEMGPVIYSWFLDRGMLVRPLGNVLYLLPPYCISNKELQETYSQIHNFLNDLPELIKLPVQDSPVFG